MIRGFDHFMVQMREMDRIFDPTREYNGTKRIVGWRRIAYNVCIAMTQWRRR